MIRLKIKAIKFNPNLDDPNEVKRQFQNSLGHLDELSQKLHFIHTIIPLNDRRVKDIFDPTLFNQQVVDQLI